jgi:hypothetical protein
MTYQGIVYISNEIRFVLETARQVNLAAQNASLAARRAGNALGFQAVSVELKKFSQVLAGAMSGMSNNILAMASGVSRAYREERYAKLYRVTQDMLSDQQKIEHALSTAKNRHNSSMGVLRTRMMELDLQVVQSMKVCNNGRALSRSALIEATRGGDMENMLRNVAHDIERTIEDIYSRLKKIGVRLMNELELI